MTPTTTPTTVRLGAETVTLLDLLKRRLHLGTRSAVLRLAVARLAEAEGVARGDETCTSK